MVVICAAVFLVAPQQKVTFSAFLATILFQFIFKSLFPEMNYFVRAMWIILIGFFLIALFSKTRFQNLRLMIQIASKQIMGLGLGMLASFSFITYHFSLIRYNQMFLIISVELIFIYYKNTNP